MIKVSVVIPVYNMEKYLKRCMDSLLKQTLKEIEIILVDDGGRDGSVKMCDDYANHYSQVKTLHKKNGGLTSAWKAGSEIAQGEYIGYIDSDDFIEPDMFERLYEKANKETADIACCGLVHLYETDNHKTWKEQMEFPKEVFDVEDLRQEMFPVLINDGKFMGRHLMPNRVTKIVKRDLVQKNLNRCDDAVSIGEDFQFSLCMFLDAQKVVIVKDYYPYYYWMNDGSMTMKYDEKYMDKIKIMKKNLIRISEEKNVFDFKPQIVNDFVCLTVLNVKGCVYKQKNQSYVKIRKDLQQICEDAQVKQAMSEANMPGLTLAEKMFLFFMKHKFYLFIYLAVRIYFR